MGVNDTDIWGVAKNEEKECFYCGEAYTPANSTAPEDFKSTYCSAECYEKDTLQMKMASDVESRYNKAENVELCECGLTAEDCSHWNQNIAGHGFTKPILDKQDREDFKMKIPKGWDKV